MKLAMADEASKEFSMEELIAKGEGVYQLHAQAVTSQRARDPRSVPRSQGVRLPQVRLMRTSILL